MRVIAFALLFVVVFAANVFAGGLTVDDFYAPIPSQTRGSYKEALNHFRGQRFNLVENNNMGYTIYAYLYTREMVKDHIQALLDEFNVGDYERVQTLIDHYSYYTPEEGQILVFTYFEAPHIENRYYKDLLDDWPNYVSLEVGVQQIQNVIERQRDVLEHYGPEPLGEESYFNGGTYPIEFSYDEDWIWTISPEWGPIEYRFIPNAYECRFEFWFSRYDIQAIEDLIDNGIMPTFRLVSSKHNLYGSKSFNNRMVSWIVRTIDPDYFAYTQKQQREKIWEGAPVDDPNPR